MDWLTPLPIFWMTIVVLIGIGVVTVLIYAIVLRLAARGWTREGGDLYETIARLDAQGCARYVVTDVTRDGTLTGPNLHLLRSVCLATDRPVIASGGVAALDDLRTLAALIPSGLEGVIVGKALYAGAFTLEAALAMAAELCAVGADPAGSGR